ncbi:hypothetical protein R1sor_022424 [Riccia sorocarpa]|uniref:tRNA pseudouridine(55) synthase n=1 Tax=Riccia sorocarpa TaxID=122646 RepID=A0ABD3GJT7_9MARC
MLDKNISSTKHSSSYSFSSRASYSEQLKLSSPNNKKERAVADPKTPSASGDGDGEGFHLSSVAVDEQYLFDSPERKPVMRSEQSEMDDGVRRVSSEVGGDEGNSEQRTFFEQWAVNKLREDGLSSLRVIEDMRQTFAPGSAPFDPQLLFSEAEFRELQNHVSATKSVQSKPIRNNSQTERPSSASKSQATAAGSKLSARSSSSDRRQDVVGTAESQSTTEEPASTQPKPLLVKRRTSLPEKWNGPGGTVVLIDKPQGWTSFAVCNKLRHVLKVQKVGHAGTLDPLATGLLIVCLGKATKLADSYQAMTKVYSGTFRLGEDTPSLDADTEVIDTLPWEHITDEDFERAKQKFVGDILQSPPMYSAIKVKGERLYAKARRGEQIDVPARQVTVHDFQITRSSENRQEFHFSVTCSKGTYIRSLCSDLGRALGSYAHLTGLRREKIGSYSVSDAWTVDDLVETYIKQFREFSSRSKA